ncbi:hypothetical protein MNBD_GAMMA10-1087 [hydrothermal vent metagenome]|uniref:Uncharacterized protein n=1 Tax=hydrothermal vent metagenome TaxID=652676 RepID=A0A3B0YD61_9ZZZZ
MKTESNVYPIGKNSESVVNNRAKVSLPPPIIRYTQGLKAMIDVLPDNTDEYLAQTIDDYRWVIELLLINIYSLSEDVSQVDAKKTIASLSRYVQSIPLCAEPELSSDQLDY